MKRNLFWVIVLALVVIPFIFALAQESLDDQGNPNDPTVNPRANACYAGAELAGKCHNDLEWIAGWYLIRFEAGMISRDQVPQDVRWVLPPAGDAPNSGNEPSIPTKPVPSRTPFPTVTPNNL